MSAYGAPPKIEALLTQHCETFPILLAVQRLGPGRVQYLEGRAPNNGNSGFRNHQTCWALDGKRATLAELRGAADADGRQTKG